jgi:hypothetical protein
MVDVFCEYKDSDLFQIKKLFKKKITPTFWMGIID